MCQDKSTLRLVGLVITALTCGIGIATIVLSCIELRTVYATWSDGPYKNLGPTQITAAVLITFASLFGFITFSRGKHPICCDFIYIVFILIGSLFCFGIGMFAAIAAAMKGRVRIISGCQPEVTGLLNIWKGVDEFFMIANSVFCSPVCPCTITSKTKEEFLNHRFASEELANMKYTVSEGDYVTSLNDCGEKTVNEVMRLYAQNPNNTLRNVDYNKFFKYWKKIEKKFDCSGWCETSYVNMFTLKKQRMTKYVFSDINRGVPKYPGCLNRVLKFLYVYTSIIASFLLFIGFLGIIGLILAFTYMGMRQQADKKGGVKIDEDDGNKKKKKEKEDAH